MQVLYHVQVRWFGRHPLLLILDKRCTYCLQFKDFDAFGNQTHGQLGKKPYCNECWNKRTREKRAQELGVPASQIERKKFPPARPGYKYCFACGKEKRFQEFHEKSESQDGYSSHCKECRNENGRTTYAAIPEEQRRVIRRQKYINNRERNLKHSRKYASKHPEKMASIQRKYRTSHPDVYRNHGQRRRARMRRLPTQEKINYQSLLEQYGWQCHICSQPIDLAIKKGHASLVFDHVIPLFPRPGNPQGTHSQDNLKPSHWICNRRKWNRPMSDLTEWDRRGP